MILDFEPKTAAYILRVDPRKHNPKKMKDEYGLNWSSSASTAREAILYTHEPYAAAPFWQYASPRARMDKELGWIIHEIEASYKKESGSHFDVPQDRELWDFQKADLDYMLRRDGMGLLDADQPGLGKTPTAIVYGNEIKAKRVLIICPAHIRFQWLRRWEEWTTMDKYLPETWHGYAIVSSKAGVHRDIAVTVASFEMARAKGIHEALMAQKFDLLIIDEAHNLKTTTAKRSVAIWGGALSHANNVFAADWETEGLASRARYVLELTGTPMPNRPREAFIHCSKLCPQSIGFMTEYAFGERFNPVEHIEVDVKQPDGSIITKWITDESSGRHGELQARMRSNFMCRHIKREVLTQLKLPAYDLVYADLDDRRTGAAIKQALKAESLLGIDPDMLSGQHADIFGHIAEARKLMGIALAPQAAEYIKMLLDGGLEKMVVFYWHIEVGNILAKALHEYNPARVDGSTSPVVKDALIQAFITDPARRVMMGNTLTLGTGTDGLQEVASYCVLTEPDWVPGNNEQCVDRLDRGGQRQTVNADFFVAPGSLSEKVLASALRKVKVTHSALDRRVA